MSRIIEGLGSGTVNSRLLVGYGRIKTPADENLVSIQRHAIS